jgi:hypothetical protein
VEQAHEGIQEELSVARGLIWNLYWTKCTTPP